MNLARHLLLPTAAVALLCAVPAHAQQPIRAGQTVSGDLSASDPKLADDSHYDLYVYRGRPGERITITLTSSDFDTFLGGGATAQSTDTDDDGAGGTNSRLEGTVGATGQYVIRVNSLQPATGRYTLAVQSGGGGGTPAPAPAPSPRPAPAAGGSGQTIRAGQTISGELTASDPKLADDSHFDLYTYQGRPGENITITLMSTAFDAFLGGGATAQSTETDDDGAGGTNARLQATVGPSGQYVIRVNTLSPGETGAYTVSVQSGGGGAPAPAPRTTPATQASNGGARTASGGPIRAGETVTGALAASDNKLDDGSFFDLYTYRGTPGEQITVTMMSTAFDAYLSGGTIRGGTLTPEARDDDGAGGTNARMVAVVGASGEFGIRANSVAAASTGAYTLRVETAARGTGPAQAQGTPIRAGQSVQGRLASGDPVLTDQSLYDLFVYQGSPGEQIEVTMSSSDFDTFLGGGEDAASAVTGADHDDDGGGGTNSQLRVTVGSNGRYVIRANSLQGNVTGAYTLAVRSAGGGGQVASGSTIRQGQTVSGRLEASDPTLQDGSHYDIYTYQGQPGEEIVVRLESTDFDPFLTWGTLFGNQYQRIAQDDDSGPGANAELRVRLDRSGTYAIQANSFGANESGAYTLRIDPASQVAQRTDATSRFPAVSIGQPVTGQLTAQDAMLSDSSYADVYLYRGEPGDQVRVTLRSTAFDSYLAVGATDGEDTRAIASDDDSGGGSDAQLNFTVEGNGTYAIQVNSYGPRATGAYTLLVERGSGAVAQRPQGGTSTAPVGAGTAGMTGKWVAAYPAVTTPRYNPMRAQLQSARRMEGVADQLNGSFPLPRNVPLLFGECGSEMGANAFYNPRDGSVTFCYEMLDYLTEGFQGVAQNQQDLAERVNGAFDFIMLHEVGHALVHQLDLPITGREEDVADQLAALVLLQDGDKGANAALSGAMALQSEGAQFDNSDFSDEHSLGPQRLFNIACWIYGSDPGKYQGWVRDGILPQARARRCPSEYEQMTKSWTRLLGRPLGRQ
ncbi:DUF4344 domain-containing metallopeptidase [Longimicrobium terrae]|uniref:Peptidase C-terminal archaeal/bacterial domain-containing protein n=1 Tax=Longimicrobium terrae TaxID=1639882 RepID=A0A841H0X8_9BACT|nr:DUF4344 domain-containing metallopeptidase [Longimicrobium terrae]MBB4637269.1 hypothetical protein [Longimicrobium terrae]MBB6071667.1 hypothetical protein [Longimicrobium terrae]NNC28428.1 DUF4344 domain-containing metallopeptidase [Longimicrobium terrae]